MYYVLLLAASGRFPSPIKNVNPVKVGNNSKLRFPTRRVAGTAQRPCDGHSPVCVCRKLQGLPLCLTWFFAGGGPSQGLCLLSALLRGSGVLHLLAVY